MRLSHLLERVAVKGLNLDLMRGLLVVHRLVHVVHVEMRLVQQSVPLGAVMENWDSTFGHQNGVIRHGPVQRVLSTAAPQFAMDGQRIARGDFAEIERKSTEPRS